MKLNENELAMCVGVGVRRRLESIRKGLKDAPGFNRSDKFDIDVTGACGELAVAKELDRYWDGSVNTFHRGDVGNLQVRTTRNSDYPTLVVQAWNSADDIFVLVAGEVPNLSVIGWYCGREAMKPEFFRSVGGRPRAYFVPAAVLHPIESLREEKCHTSSRKRKSPAKRRSAARPSAG